MKKRGKGRRYIYIVDCRESDCEFKTVCLCQAWTYIYVYKEVTVLNQSHKRMATTSQVMASETEIIW